MSEQPFEVMYGGLSGIIRGCKSVKAGLNKATRHVLDPVGEVWARSDKLQAEAEKSISGIKVALAKERSLLIRRERSRDSWASPSCIDGWLCPDSPTSVCVYDEPPNWDCCDYCGFPNERK